MTVPETCWLSSEMAFTSLPIRFVELVMFWPNSTESSVLGELVGRADLADLVDLVEHLRVVQRIERILILHFVDQQLQEHVEVEVVERVVLAELLVAADVWRSVAKGFVTWLGFSSVRFRRASADLRDDVDAGVGDGPADGRRFFGCWWRGGAADGAVAVRSGIVSLVLAVFLRAGIRLPAAAGVAADVDVEPLDLARSVRRADRGGPASCRAAVGGRSRCRFRSSP